MLTLLNQLQENKGTVSSAFGKELAKEKEIISGKKEILAEALQLIHFDDKNVRSGAAKIIEKVAEEKPEFISVHLSNLVPYMNYKETPTSCMVL